MVMGCYGIGITRTIAAVIEQNHDEDGIIWPWPVAPVHVHLVSLDAGNPEISAVAESWNASSKRQDSKSSTTTASASHRASSSRMPTCWACRCV